MSLPAHLLGLVALLPAMSGPVTGGPGAASDTPLVLALCSGGSMALSSARSVGGERVPGPVTQPCCAKGCHRDERRRRNRVIDREQ